MDNLSLALPFIMHHPFALGTVSLCQKLANPRLFRQSLQQSAHQRLPLLRRRFCDLVKTRVWMPPAPDHHLFIHRFCFLHKGCFTHGALPFGLVSICPLFYLFFPRELFRDAPKQRHKATLFQVWERCFTCCCGVQKETAGEPVSVSAILVRQQSLGKCAAPTHHRRRKADVGPLSLNATLVG